MPNNMRLLILTFVFFSCLPLISFAKEVDVEGIFSQMSELRLDISKPVGKTPMMLKIFPASKKKNIKLNENSLINGFLVSLIIYYENDRTRLRMFAPGSSVLMYPKFIECNIENPIPLEFVTHYVFNIIYQEIEDLKIDQIKSVSMKIYFEKMTENSIETRVRFVNKPLVFSKDEILKLIENYKEDPFALDIQKVKIPQNQKVENRLKNAK